MIYEWADPFNDEYIDILIEYMEYLVNISIDKSSIWCLLYLVANYYYMDPPKFQNITEKIIKISAKKMT